MKKQLLLSIAMMLVTLGISVAFADVVSIGSGTAYSNYFYSASTGKNWYLRKDTTAPTGTETTGALNANRVNVQLTIPSFTPNPTPSLAVIGTPTDLATGQGLLPTLSWSAGGGNAPIGYRLYYGTDGAGMTLPTTIQNNVDKGLTASFVTPSNLSLSTTYYWAVVPYNADGDGPYNIWRFTTGTGFVYAASYATSTADDDIGQFTMAISSGTFSNPVTTPTLLTNNPAATGTYTDYTAMTINVAMDHIYPVSILQINSESMYACQAAVYIDFNQNGNFDLPDEQVFLGATSTSGPVNPVTGSIAIPYGNPGTTRLRVVLKEGTSGIAPTGTYTWGETEDYSINIGYTPPPPPWIELLTPNSGEFSSLTPTFSWQLHYYIKEPVTYKISIGTDNPPTNIGLDSDVGSATSYTPAAGLFNYGTTYYWQVKAYFSTELFVISDLVHFDTMDDPTITSFPYSQGFETTTFPPAGWSLSTTAMNTWSRWTGTEVHSGTACARALYSGAGTKSLTSPPISISGSTYLSWWWKNDDITSKVVAYDSTFAEITTDGGATWTTLAMLSPSTNETDYHQVIVSLTSYPGTVQIRWRYKTDGTTNAWGIGLDDILITQVIPPPYYATVILPATPLGGSSSDSFHISNIGDLLYISGTISYSAGLSGPSTFTTEGTGTAGTDIEVTYTPTEQGLFTGTVTVNYQDGSFQVSVVSNAGITAVDWESVPAGWSVYDLDANNYTWAWYTGAPHSGTYSVGDYYNSAGNNDWMISPWYTIQAGDELTFFAKSMDAGYPEALKVLVSSTGNTLSDFTTTLLDLTAIPGTYTGYSIPLTSLSGQTVSFAFQDYSLNSWYLMLDDIGLPSLTNVNSPAGCTVEKVGANIKLSWSAVPHATSYRVYSSSNPNVSSELWTLESEVVTNSYTDLSPVSVKFYKITAVNGSKSNNSINALTAGKSFGSTSIKSKNKR